MDKISVVKSCPIWAIIFLCTVGFVVCSMHHNKLKEYLKAKIEELETNSMIKNIRDLYRGISYFKKGYQVRTNIAEDRKSDVCTDGHSIFAK